MKEVIQSAADAKQPFYVLDHKSFVHSARKIIFATKDRDDLPCVELYIISILYKSIYF